MNKTEEKRRNEPLFHIEKRSSSAVSWKQALLIRVGSVLGAFLLAGLLSTVLIGIDPISFMDRMIDGIIGSDRRIWIFLRDTAILLGIALALAPAFKMRFWNVGAEGQVLMGGLAAAICMHYLGDKLPDPLVWISMLLAAIVVGGVWAVIPAIFKAKWNTNETLFTLMMNYIAMQLIAFFTNVWVSDGSNTLKNDPHLNGIKFPELGNPYLLTIFTVVLLTVGMYIYLKYSKQGYEISVVGESENTARYVGINVKKVVIRTLIISGAICGVIGVLLVGAINGTVKDTTVGGQGFTGIIVTWLGQFNPLYMILTACLVIFLARGTGNLNLTSNAFSSIITGVVIFVIIGCEFFIHYKIKFLKKKEKTEEESAPPEDSGLQEDEPDEESGRLVDNEQEQEVEQK